MIGGEQQSPPWRGIEIEFGVFIQVVGSPQFSDFMFRNVVVRSNGRLSGLSNFKFKICWNISKRLGGHIYVLFIRSVAEYCSVSFHSSLAQEQSRKLEGIQRTWVKVILGEDYVSYKTALQRLGLKSLEEHRINRCLDFSLKCLKLG